MAATVLATVTLLGAVAAPAASASTAPYAVYLGYVDNIRPNPTHFPTPWYGSPNFVLNGCQTNCSYDGGAIELVNTTNAAETVSAFEVDLGTCDYTIWNSDLPATLPAGGEMAFAQTASGSSSGCDTSGGDFDTSDIGPNSSNWAANCSQSGVVPVIKVTVNGAAAQYTDTGQVINTGGFDKGACSTLDANPQPYIFNESEQWTPVGDAAYSCQASTLSLAPSSQSLAPGGTADLTATFKDQCGAPIQGVQVSLAINSGPNASQGPFTATTNASGQAAFSYSADNFGIDHLSASIENDVGTITSNPATVTWQTATLSLKPSSGLPGSAIAYSGTGYADGETVNLYFNSPSGVELTTTTASSTGTISGKFTVPTPSGGAAPNSVVAAGQTSGKEGWAVFTASCTTDWLPTTSGSFNTASNWSGGAVPGPSDLACILQPGTYTVTLNSSDTVGGLVLGAATTTTGQQTLEMPGYSTTLTLNGPSTINPGGALTMTSLDGNWDQLNGAGPLTNNGTFSTLTGDGSQRYLRTNITNGGKGTISLGDFDNRLDSGNTLVNDGAFTITPSGDLSVSGSSTLQQAKGTLTLPSVVDPLVVNGGTFDSTGGSVSGTVVLQSGSLDDTGGNGGTYIMQCDNGISGTIASHQIIDVQGNSCGGATTTVETPTLVNKGTLELDSTDGNYAQLNGTTLVNDATFETLEDNGGPRYIQTAVTNNASGSMLLYSVDNIMSSGNLFTNNGTFTLEGVTNNDSGGSLAISSSTSVAQAGTFNVAGSLSMSSGTFTQSAGTLANTGSFSASNITFVFGGGKTTGNENLLANSTFTDNSTGAGLFAFQNTTTVNTTAPDGNGNIDIAAGQVMDLQDFCAGVANWNLSQGVDIAGTVKTTSSPTCSGYNVGINTPASTTPVNVLSGGTLTFGPNGSEVNSGVRQIEGTFTNESGGTVTLNTAVQMAGGDPASNSGTFTVASTGAFTLSSATLTQAAGTLADNGSVEVSSGTFTFNGGTTSGNQILLANSTLNDNTSDAGLFALQNSDTLATATPDGSGNIAVASGQLLDVQDVCAGAASLTAAKAIDLSGTLETGNGGTCGGYNYTITAPSINVLSGGTLASGAAVPGHTGTRTLDAVVNNAGTFSIGDGGGVTFGSGDGLDQASGGTLGVTVDAANGVSGITDGTNTLNGTLSITTVGTPSNGSTYQAIASATDTGTFSSVKSSFPYTVSYSPSAVTLTAT